MIRPDGLRQLSIDGQTADRNLVPFEIALWHRRRQECLEVDHTEVLGAKNQELVSEITFQIGKTLGQQGRIPRLPSRRNPHMITLTDQFLDTRFAIPSILATKHGLWIRDQCLDTTGQVQVAAPHRDLMR